MQDIAKELEEIVVELVKIAKEDDEISEQENKFIERMEKDLNEFKKIIKANLQDDVISEDEFHEIIIERDRILNDALDFESESEDISKLIQKLFDTMNKIKLPGMLSEEEPDE